MTVKRWLRRGVAVTALMMLTACGGDPEGEPIRFSVVQGTGLSAVADTLSNREIIEWPLLFRLYGQMKGVAASIKPGVYEVQAGTAWDDILQKLVDGDIVREALVIPEGWTAVQIAGRLAAMAELPVDSVISLLLDSAAAEAIAQTTGDGRE